MKRTTPREKEILRKSVEVITKHFDPSKILLFGSRATDRFDRGSDFDLAVDMKQPDIDEIRKLNEALEAFSGLYKVDVIFLQSVEKPFKEIVLEKGSVVYERSKVCP